MRVSVDRQSLAGIQQLHREFGASATSGQMLYAKLFLWLRRHFICEQSPVRKPAVADTGRGEAARRGRYPVFGLVRGASGFGAKRGNPCSACVEAFLGFILRDDDGCYDESRTKCWLCQRVCI